MLKNCMGGLDWAGVPYVCAHLGLDNVPALLDAIHTIKTYTPPDKGE